LYSPIELDSCIAEDGEKPDAIVSRPFVALLTTAPSLSVWTIDPVGTGDDAAADCVTDAGTTGRVNDVAQEFVA
jgi:hypothetical protein